MTDTEQRSLILRERYDLTVPQHTLIKRGLMLAEFLEKKNGIGKTKSAVNLTKEDHAQTEWVKRAIVLEQIKDWQGLLDWCRKWTKSEPQNALAWHCLGIANGCLKRYTGAISAFRRSLHINPKNHRVWTLLGFTYRNSYQFEKAIAACRRAVKLNPEDAHAWHSLGLAYDSFEQIDKAIKAFQQVVKINPEDDYAWNNLGFAYDEFEQRDKAIKAYQQALHINPANHDASLGIISKRRGNFDSQRSERKLLRAIFGL